MFSLFRYFAFVISLCRLRYFVMSPSLFRLFVFSLSSFRLFAFVFSSFRYGAFVMSPRNNEKTKWHKSATIYCREKSCWKRDACSFQGFVFEFVLRLSCAKSNKVHDLFQFFKRITHTCIILCIDSCGSVHTCVRHIIFVFRVTRKKALFFMRRRCTTYFIFYIKHLTFWYQLYSWCQK